MKKILSWKTAQADIGSGTVPSADVSKKSRMYFVNMPRLPTDSIGLIRLLVNRFTLQTAPSQVELELNQDPSKLPWLKTICYWL